MARINVSLSLSFFGSHIYVKDIGTHEMNGRKMKKLERLYISFNLINSMLVSHHSPLLFDLSPSYTTRARNGNIHENHIVYEVT